MGVTARGLHYPEATDRPDGAGQMQQLAEDIEAVAAALITDSGTRGDLPLVAAAGFAVLAGNYRLIGKNMFAAVWLTRTGVPIVSNSTGNITDVTLCTISDPALRPSIDTCAGWRGFTCGGEASVIAASGNINLVSQNANSTIATHTDDTPSIVRAYVTYAVV